MRSRDRKAPDNVLVGDVVALCIRVRDEQREEDAKKCDAIGEPLAPLGLARKTANACAAAIRNGEQL